MITAPIFTTDISSTDITPEIAVKYIKRHQQEELPRLLSLQDYYDGRHPIRYRHKQSDNLCNNRLTTNHASYIADFSSAYLLGSPVSYTGNDAQEVFDALRKADSATQDAALALDCAIFGQAFDMVYMSDDDQPCPKLARLSPLNTFVVYDDTVEQAPVFAVYYFPVHDDNGACIGYRCTTQTDRLIYDFDATTSMTVSAVNDVREHYFGMVPINEIYNNGRRRGDFEAVLSLIDAYNLLQSDRVNDKEQFVNALLIIKGASLGDDDDDKIATIEALKAHGVMEIPGDGADAYYLVRQFDENNVEVLKRSICDDIHKISCVPDMTDENFAANASGVAMKYKLLGLEQLTKTKERYFSEGLRYRLQLIANVLGVNLDVSTVDITFKRSLPANELEIAQTVTQLQGLVPLETLLAQIPFVPDAKAAADELRQEQEKERQSNINFFANTPLVGDADEETE